MISGFMQVVHTTRWMLTLSRSLGQDAFFWVSAQFMHTYLCVFRKLTRFVLPSCERRA